MNNVITTLIITYIYFIRAKQMETLIQSGLKQMSNRKDKITAYRTTRKKASLHVNVSSDGSGAIGVKRYLHVLTDVRARGSPCDL